MSVEIEGLEELEPIGRGGSSDVYRAHDVELDKAVAVKVLRVEGAEEDTARLFMRECRATDAIEPHSNIATVHRYGITGNGVPFVVMEEASAGSLADLLKQGPLDIDRAVELARGIVDGLRAADAQGVMHRDVKPANVLIGDDGRAMLTDFGIAGVIGASITTTSGNPYTLAYAPPEVLRGQPADERSDVYAVGATLFEMLEGRPPFATLGLTPAEIMGRALSTPAPPITRTDLPPNLRDLVAHALDVDPARRPTLDEVAAALDPDNDGPYVGGRKGSRGGGDRRRRRSLTVVAIVPALAVAGGAIAFVALDDENDGDGGEQVADSPTTTTIRAWVEGTDESPELAAASLPLVASMEQVLGEPATTVDVPFSVSFPESADFPPIKSFPSTDFWLFSSTPVQEKGCREYFPPGLTVTGFSAKYMTFPNFKASIVLYALDAENGAAQMFQGRTIAIGVTPETCSVSGADVDITQQEAPPAGTPAWSDELSSWVLDGVYLSSGDRAGYAYIIRAGRWIWEIRVTQNGDRPLTPEGLSAVIDAAGAASAELTGRTP